MKKKDKKTKWRKYYFLNLDISDSETTTDGSLSEKINQNQSTGSNVMVKVKI